MTLHAFIAVLAASIAVSGGPALSATPEPPLAISSSDASLKWSPCPAPFTAGCEIAVLHGDPGRANADIYLRTPGGYVIPPHSHSSAERMILVGGELQVRYKGASPVTLRPGDYAYGPAALPHEGRCLGQAPCILFIAFEGPVDAIASSPIAR